MESNTEARDKLTKYCICLTGLPDDVAPNVVCQSLPEAQKAAKVTTPFGDGHKWLILFQTPNAALNYNQKKDHNLNINGQQVQAKIDQFIPCDIPEEWLAGFTEPGGEKHPLPDQSNAYLHQYPGQQYQGYAYQSPGGQPFQYPGHPGYNPPQGLYPTLPHQGPQPHGDPSARTDQEHTAPKGPFPGNIPPHGFQPHPQYPWYPGVPPDGQQHGDHQPPAGNFPLGPFPGNQQWGFYQGWPQQFPYPAAPPPYQSQKHEKSKQEEEHGNPPHDDQENTDFELHGYESNVIRREQDEFLDKIKQKGKKEEKRMSSEPKETNMIKVSDLPKKTTKDGLTFFFENRRKSGGGETEDVDFDTSDMTAIITFKDPEAVQRVLKKLPMLFQDKQITVEEFYPGGGDGDDSDNADDEDKDEEENQPLCTIEVRGFKPDSSDDTIQFYFENKRRSGGGDIEKFEREEDVIYITFESEDVVQNVLKKIHKIDGQQIEVIQYIPPPPPKPRPMYDDKVFIHGMNPDTSQDCLTNFIEAKSGVCPSQIIYGEEDGTALVSFDEVPDFDKLQLACKKRKLEGFYLNVSKVPITNCILVSGFKESTSQDTLEFYFENKRRSAGGEIEKIQLNKEDGTCLVFFEDHTVLDEVCKREHTIDEQKLKVRVYHECLGQISDEEDGSVEGASGGAGGGRKFKQPEPFSIDADKRKIEFLKHSKSVREAVEKQLKSCHAKIGWPSRKDDPVVIDCTLTPDVKDCRNLAKTWKKSATDNVNQFLDALIVEDHTALQEAWTPVMEGLQSLTISHPDGVAVITEPEKCTIIIVGYKHIVTSVSKQVKEVITKVGEDLDRKKKQMTEKVSLRYHQLRLLIINHFREKMSKKFEGLKIDISLKIYEITFEGLVSEINAAKLEMYEAYLNKIVSSKIGQFSQEKIDFCDSKKVREYLVNKLKSEGIVAVWEIESQKVVRMYALSDKVSVKATHIFQKSIVETPVELKPESLYLLEAQKWDDKKKEVESINPGLVKVVPMPKQQQIIVFTTTENAGTCRELVEDFFTFNTVCEKALCLPSSEMRFLQQHHNKDIMDIARDLKQEQVQISINNAEIKIKGTSIGLNQAIQRVDQIVQKIVKRQHTFSKPSIAKYIDTEEGQSKLHKVEKVKKVIFDSSESGDSDEFEMVDDPNSVSSKKHQEVASCLAPGGQRIIVVKGDLTELNVDVIVNAANKDLKHIGGLAKAIVSKGGYSIQQQCTDRVNKKGQLLEGDVFCSKSGNLSCNVIIHAVGPVWQSGTNNEEELLREVVYKSLEEGSNKHLRSIGIPAICTGIFGFPVKLAAKTIAESLRDFFKDTADSSIKDVYLCDIADTTIAAFVEGLKKMFGAKQVQESKSRSKYGNQWTTPAQKKGGRIPTPFTQAYDDDGGDDQVAGSRNIRIRVIKGQIAQQSVDAIVNTTSRDLQLSNGAVSASILKAGGPTLQQECSNDYPNGIKHGDIAVTNGGNLSCKKVYHGSLPGWDTNGTALGILQKFMDKCLEEADNDGFKTVAFPAMGTGNLGFPKDIVAKEMFQCIGKFSSQNPSSSIREVRFVLYDKDIPTVKAFEDYEKHWNGGSGGGAGYGRGGHDGGGRKGRRFDSNSENAPSDFQGQRQRGGGYERDDDTEGRPKNHNKGKGHGDSSAFKIGELVLKVYQGDITMAKTDAIVNSSNSEIDLSRGAVAQAISKKGGSDLKQQVQLQVESMKQDGIAVTTSGSGPMSCKYIIHINAEDSKGWKSRILKSLKKAENLKLSKIAFPALGTGAGFGGQVADVADSLFDAVMEFEDSSHHSLKEIHMVIFQSSMVKDFQREIQKCMDSKTGKSKGFFQRLGEYFLGAGEEEKKFKPKKEKGKGKKGQEGTSQEMQAKLTVVIYADSQKIIDEAIKMFEELCEKEFHIKDFHDRIIKDFSPSQKQAVYSLKRFGVEVKFEERIGRIQLYGLTSDLMNAADSIHKLIRDAERNKQAKQQAELVADMVQWHYIEIESSGKKLTEYPGPINLILEQAYRETKSKATFCDTAGTEYTVDFNQYKEYPTNNPNDTVEVIRRDKMRDTTFEPPANWATMKDQENVTVVAVNSTDVEYQNVIQKFKSSSGGNYNIVKLERIQNRTLYQQYVAKKKLMDGQNKQGHQNEHELWHGTAGNAIDSINTYGFNRSYCGKNATAYGNGVYFAVNASYSCGGTYSPPDQAGNKHVYLAKVLTGEYTKGQGGMRVPPQKSNHILYDSVVDNPNGPGMYIIFNDTQAYPEYLITFK